jgi:hypothetical protein
MRGYTTALRMGNYIYSLINLLFVELDEERSAVALTNIYPSIINTGLFGGVNPKL